MVHFLQIAVILVSLISSIKARNGCRQCVGAKAITFKPYVTRDQAEQYVKASFGDCATGNDYTYLGVNSVTDTCQPGTNPVECKTWMVGFNVWRYCGNGPSVILNKFDVCSDGWCVVSDKLKLECSKSVECDNKCTLNLCE